MDFQVGIEPEVKTFKEIRCRNLKKIDMEKFMKTVADRIDISESNTFGENVTTYNTVLSELVDMEAPMTTRSVKIVPSAPWFDGEYRELRKRRRKAEKTFKRTQLAEHKEDLINLRKKTTQLAHLKKCKHYGDKLERDKKLMYSSINKLLDNEQEEVLPDAESSESLANFCSTLVRR